MANIYPEQNKDRPAEKNDDQTPEKTMGIYDRSKRKGPSRALIIAVILAIIILAWILLAGFSGGAEAFTVTSLENGVQSLITGRAVEGVMS